jgi:hypothetical protein
MVSWADHWQLKLSPKKCVVALYLGVSNVTAADYTIRCVTLPVVDLGVMQRCDNHSSVSCGIDKTVSKASSRARL